MAPANYSKKLLDLFTFSSPFKFIFQYVRASEKFSDRQYSSAIWTTVEKKN